MKFEYLIVIFLIIIIPIIMVLSEYVNNKIEIQQTEISYDTKLLNSTYAAVKAYQLNTINNNYADVATSKVEDVEAAANVFYNTLASNFNYTGYKMETMKSYVPAVVFTLYDGYYIYSPYTNTLTSEMDSNGDPTLKSSPDYTGDNATVDSDYANGETLSGLKPYVYYTCRYYINNDNDFVINYTLDNYITVEGIVGGEYVYKGGYLISGITPSNGSKPEDSEYFTYDGIYFYKTDTEALHEWLGDAEYYYVKINGTKYYLNTGSTVTSGKIFSINTDGSRNYSQASSTSDQDTYKKYYYAIMNNKAAYEYYKNSYEFTTWVTANLSNLSTKNAIIYDNGGSRLDAEDVFGNLEIFPKDQNGVNFEYSTSKFNQHRQAVIRYVVETNLSTAIAGFSSSASSDFIMPKISESDWDIIENNVCCISFLQGLNLGSKKYNSYSVVANTLTKEYVDENDIYILLDNGTYCKVNDSSLYKTSGGDDPTVTAETFDKLKYYARSI